MARWRSLARQRDTEACSSLRLGVRSIFCRPLHLRDATGGNEGEDAQEGDFPEDDVQALREAGAEQVEHLGAECGGGGGIAISAKCQLTQIAPSSAPGSANATHPPPAQVRR